MVNSWRCLCIWDHTLGEIRTRTLRKVHLYTLLWEKQRKSASSWTKYEKKYANDCHFDKMTDGWWCVVIM